MRPQLHARTYLRRPANSLRRRSTAVRTAVALALLGLSAMRPDPARADSATGGISVGSRFAERDGAALYGAICQSCHMADGRGAHGAGSYPALAADARLASASYPVYTVLHGRKGMPPFGAMLSDEQVAAVTDFVRTHFGNAYAEPVTAAEVGKLR